MICWYCNQVFSFDNKIKCKFDGQIIPQDVLLSKRSYDGCPIEPKGKEVKSD